MDLKGVNTGENNTYQEIQVKDNSQYIAKAENVYLQPSPQSRMDTYFQRLLAEIEKGIKGEVFDSLKYYQTKLDGTKGVEEKLADGGFRPAKIQEAKRLKELYAKIAMRYDCYPSAQKIIYDLFARIKHEFDTSIFPLIEQQQPVTILMQNIRNKIVIPIRDMLESNGSHDTVLGFNEDHIYGMIYYLTGMCHLNWKDYDNI